MKVKISGGKDYESKYEWDCFCQGGTSGIVLPSGGFNKVFESDDPLKELIEESLDDESYITAFFEAFPKNPSCFLRGEGKTIEEAEEECWKKYQKVLNCNHEMERRDRTDGYAYCKHCSYSSTVFEPLTKCCKCKTLTAYTQDYKGNWYCKKHARFKIKNPNPTRFDRMDNNRLPRKRKKLLKKCVTNKFRENDIFGKVKFKYLIFIDFICDDKRISFVTKNQERNFIRKYKNARSKI